MQQKIEALVAGQREHHSLAQAFYKDPDIYDREIERIFLRAWLYAGHTSEIPNVGDWFLFEFAEESVIIIRSAEEQVNALLNVCRHRGSRVCVESSGCSRRLTCRYHGWTYDMQGQLRAAAHMGDDFDKSDNGLHRIHAEVLDGLIFINFADEPSSFDPVREGLSDALKPYDLANAKVAHRENYPIKANWKLSLENYTECYHCAPSHPEYSRGHSLAEPDSRTSELNAAVMARASACGLSDQRINSFYESAEGFGNDFSYDRYALWRDHVTGSPDGQPIAPLMGSIIDYDGGATDLQVGPVTFGLMYCDHVVLYRFTPRSLNESDCDITWLVRGDAEEGTDYDKEKLTWLWDITTQADKTIIERNAEGVNSRFYRSGRLSEMEDYTWRLLSWYLDSMKLDPGKQDPGGNG
jgi:phenylpropionate dioxygenase-like ring-hydroxylating dioxygenase large terminal subunit